MTQQHLDKTLPMTQEEEALKTLVQTCMLETTCIGEGTASEEAGEIKGCFIKGQRYDIGRILGAGGMGVVMQAYDKNLQRSVAMKVLQGARVTDGSHALRFIREAEITGALEHPNIIPLHELGLDTGSNAYYTMKQVKGETLKAVLKKLDEGDAAYLKKYPFQRLIEVFLKVCDAVSLAHHKGVIHRDLKPENIMIGDFGEVLVIDWGLARRAHDDLTADGDSPDLDNPLEFVTQAGAVMGTPGFMAPEQARGGEVGPSSDSFSLGAILYAILTFRPPVTGNNLRELLLKLLQGDIPTPEEKWANHPDGRRPHHLPRATVPSGISAVTMKALAHSRANRYGSVAELKQDVQSFQSGYATDAEAASPFRQLVLLLYRSRRILSVCGLLVLSFSVFVALFTQGLLKEIDKAKEEERLADISRKVADDQISLADTVFNSLIENTPSIEKQARYKLANNQVPEALQLVVQAIFLEPDNGRLYELKGDILQNLFRFEDAGAAYQDALDRHSPRPGLLEKLETSKNLVGAQKRNFPDELQTLNRHFLDSGRFQQSLHLLLQLGRNQKPYLETGNALLQKWGWDAELIRHRDFMYGQFSTKRGLYGLKLAVNQCDPYLNLRTIPGFGMRNLQIKGAAFLTGGDALAKQCRLERLSIQGVDAFDFESVKGLAAIRINITANDFKNVELLKTMVPKVVSLGGLGVTQECLERLPLAGIETLKLVDTKTSSIDFLQHGTSLRTLILNENPVSDITVFSTMPETHFTELVFDNTRVIDLSPLSKHSVDYLNFNHTNVFSLDSINPDTLISIQAVGTHVNTLEYFRAKRFPSLKYLMVGDCWLTDLSPLAGLQLKHVTIRNTPVSDITPLSRMYLTQFHADDTMVADLSPLKFEIMEILHIRGSLVEDLTPLNACKRLKDIKFSPEKVKKGVEVLRSLTTLETINGRPAGEFWAGDDMRDNRGNDHDR